MQRPVVLVLVAAVVAGCSALGIEKPPLVTTPPGDVAGAAVARVPVAPPAGAAAATPAPPKVALVPPGSAVPRTATPVPAIVPPAGSQYVCAIDAGGERHLTAIEFAPKVGDLCRKHPEMGPCQYERNNCRRSGGRVYASSGEITLAHEAEYDKKVMRVRFRAE